MSGQGWSFVKHGLDHTPSSGQLLDKAATGGGFLSPCRNRCHCLSSGKTKVRASMHPRRFLARNGLVEPL